jgi:hypothetical protein
MIQNLFFGLIGTKGDFKMKKEYQEKIRAFNNLRFKLMGILTRNPKLLKEFVDQINVENIQKTFLINEYNAKNLLKLYQEKDLK